MCLFMSALLTQFVSQYCVLYLLQVSNHPMASCEPISWKKTIFVSLVRVLYFLHVSNLPMFLDLSSRLTQVVSHFCGRKLLFYLLVGSFIFFINELLDKIKWSFVAVPYNMSFGSHWQVIVVIKWFSTLVLSLEDQ